MNCIGFFRNNLFPENHFSWVYSAWICLLMFSCTIKEQSIQILEFTGTGEVCNYTKTPLSFVADSLNPAALLGSNGDVFAVEDFILVNNEDYPSGTFDIRCDDSVLWVNNKIYGIDIPDDTSMIPWFRNMDRKNLSALQFIYFNSGVNNDYLPYLETLAGINPNAGIFFEGNIKELTELPGLFQPRYIIGSEFQKGDFDALKGQNHLEILWIKPGKSVLSDPLPGLTALKKVCLDLSDGGDSGFSPDFFIKNRQVEDVVILFAESFDLSVLNPLTNLKGLVVGYPDTLFNTETLILHKKLELLSLSGSDLGKELQKIRLPSLRWITFDSGVTQGIFNDFIERHPNLEVVELLNNDKVTSLKKLSGLAQLTGLTVTDTVTDITTLRSLKNLKYLSLPDDFPGDSSKIKDLQGALPNTRIASNGGYLCLGSGWLLLLVPLVLLFRFYLNRKRWSVQDNLQN